VRRRSAFLVGGAIAAALALGGLVGGVLAESRSAASSGAASVAFADRALTGAAGGIGASSLTALEAQVRAQPRNATLLTRLGYAYQLRWRVTSDASYLPRAESVLRRAVRVEADDADALLGLGLVAASRHRFREALSYGRRAQPLLPGSARPYGVIGDSLLELGRYEQAFATFDRMVSLRPNLGSYSRVAYARELTGDRAGAISAMTLALDTAAGQPEATAWARVEIAKLHLSGGRLELARRHLSAALRASPGYPRARVELAHIDAAQARLVRALAQAQRAAEAAPTGDSLGVYAELLDRAGRPALAREQRALIDALDRDLRAGGVRIDLDLARYRANNRIRPRATVELARRARARTPSVVADDVLSWALARAGRCDEALPFARRALRLGTEDALLYFHRGYAEGCAGNRAAMRAWYAKALALSPAFSIRWEPVARAAIDG
jgi:tetratricopeptide (TPR) repeat protein